jgi:small subunit ribosomal protein S9
MAEDKKTEQGEVEQPQEIAAEDAVGAQETPDEAQQEREQALVDEPVAAAEETPAAAAEETPAAAAEETAPAAAEAPAAEEAAAPPAAAPAAEADDEDEAPTPRVKPAIPGADLEVDIVREGEDALGGRSPYDEDGDYEDGGAEGEAEDLTQPIADASIDLAADARYRATGKRKTAVARVTLRPGTGAYTINGRTLEAFFPRNALQRTIRQPLETVGYETRMDVVASMHGGGVSAQAGALRHGVSRALLEADPNLRSELKRRGFLTRDARVKERKKAGLKKARKRPQFSKR